jgi:hypothetical protein
MKLNVYFGTRPAPVDTLRQQQMQQQFSWQKAHFIIQRSGGSKRTQPHFNLGLRIRRFGRKKKAIGDKKIPDSI